jgi:hypothetical protein
MTVPHRRPVRAIALAIVSAGSLAAGPARAQDVGRKRDFEVGMDFGWTGFRSAAAEPNGSRLSLNGAYFLARGVALLADITCLGGTERGVVANPGFTMCTGSLGATLDVRVLPGLVPYLRLGFGQTQLDRGAQAGVFDVEERSAALLAGAGARLYLGSRRKLAVRLDALWTRTDVFGGRATHPSVALGVVYRITPSR